METINEAWQWVWQMENPDIEILWDELTREMRIIAAGQVIELAGRFNDRDEAIEAAVTHCRTVGLLADEMA